MDYQSEIKFFQHVLSFFTQQPKSTPAAPDGNAAGTPAPAEPEGSPDIPLLVTILRAAGFGVTYNDKSEVGGSSEGCRLILVCKRSGSRVVMDSLGTCTCPPEEELKRLLHHKVPVGSLIVSVSAPSLETASSASSTADTKTAPSDEVQSSAPTGEEPGEVPKMVRQRTWSREDLPNALNVTMSEEMRRQSAPPLPPAFGLSEDPSCHSHWASITGDELNVAAATDHLKEALSLLSGIKRPTLRNTPLAPARGVGAANRRVSSDASLLPRRSGSHQALSLSRSSSVSSGLATSPWSSSSSTCEPPPRPPTAIRAAVASSTRTSLRRTLSAASSAKSGVPKTGDSSATTGSSNSRSFASRLPSYLKVSQQKRGGGASPSPRQQSNLSAGSSKIPHSLPRAQ